MPSHLWIQSSSLPLACCPFWSSLTPFCVCLQVPWLHAVYAVLGAGVFTLVSLAQLPWATCSGSPCPQPPLPPLYAPVFLPAPSWEHLWEGLCSILGAVFRRCRVAG